VGNNLREHTNSIKNGSEDCRNFLNKGVSGKEDVILLGPLLNRFLLLVEFLESFKIDDINIETLGFFQVFGISDQTDLELGSRNVRKSDGTGKSLIFLGIVVLKSDLEFNCFNELSLFSVFENSIDAFCDLLLGESAHIF
jgi:hypothetical protein